MRGRVANEIVAERFGPNGKDQRDMLGSFIRHSVTREEAAPGLLLQL